jgi:RNA polymerase sigma factor (TIGR02999 family)
MSGYTGTERFAAQRGPIPVGAGAREPFAARIRFATLEMSVGAPIPRAVIVRAPRWYRPRVPPRSRPELVTEALESAREGDEAALATLYGEVYDELYQLARRQRRRWTGNETLDTTALVHESYLKLVDRSRFAWNDLRHFFAVAARAMRHILINYAEQARAAKRGGDRARIDLDDAMAASTAEQETLVILGAGVDELTRVDERRAQVFEYRFFLGLSVTETAELLDISPATVKRDWTMACAFLRVYLEG